MMRTLAVLALTFAAPFIASAASVDFSREILPILSDKCFVCHGPDTRKAADLRLDSFEAATADRGGYRAIDPDAPEKSELLKRIHDADDPMPPEKAEKKLTERERELLARWVRQGGDYQKHWAFVPPTREAGRSIDSFIEEKLTGAGVEFAAPADRATLARRTALVLEGLPPEPDQLGALLADRRTDAFPRLIDQLMSSPRYGEHQARYWLDAVRYGDTHGLHLDNRRGIFPYRDWVVKALNDNLPLDDFLVWQLAGDLLPEPTLEQRIATGFVRMNPSTSEGGAIPEEFQAKNNFDRVETLGTVLLGMSLTCARCHTHKYDPIPQTEYYRLMAFFNSTAESAMDGNAYIYGPVEQVPANPANWPGWLEFRRERADLVNGVDETTQAALLTYAPKTQSWTAGEWKMSDAFNTGATPLPVDKWKPAKGLPGQLRDRLPKPGQTRLIAFQIKTKTDQTLVMTLSSGPGFEIRVDGVELENAKRVQPLSLKAGMHELRVTLTGTANKTKIELKLSDPWQSLAKNGVWSQCDERDRLLMLAERYGPKIDSALVDRAAVLAGRMLELEGDLTTTLVARDLAKPRETRLLNRGEYDQPVGESLQPGVLNVMGALRKDAPANRLGLAQWLTAREHPLVARVWINRVWQRVFGHGLVRTPEDFGLQGQQATHPELLDWLAVELQESGWDLKHMLRLMLMSRTFQQASAHRPGLEDPENRLFARGPSHRLDAEVLRDIALWSGGLLDPHIGGEGVKPYQPSGMWKALTHPASNTVEYSPDTDSRVFRRSLYVYWKRTSPHPMMTLFDAPSRESSCVKRSRSNTALQSLGLLNETQRLESARRLAARLLREKDDASRLKQLYTLLASREPSAAERVACEALLTAMRKRYTASPDDARALLSVGGGQPNVKLNPVEHAAWAQVANAVLASDAAILLY
jgi:hypothetical protein